MADTAGFTDENFSSDDTVDIVAEMIWTQKGATATERSWMQCIRDAEEIVAFVRTRGNK